MATVKGTAKLKKIMYPKGVYSTGGGWAIASFVPIEMEEGDVEVHKDFRTFSLKGDMPPLKEGQEYYFIAEEGERHPTFGISYDLAFMRQNVDLDTQDEASVRDFLEIILTKRQVNALFEALSNPIGAIENKDIQSLIKASGIGMKTAERIIEHYESQKDYSFAYIELSKYDLTPKSIRKITDYYGSPELAVAKVKENPYELMRIDGYSFRSCDKIYLSLGKDPSASLRVKSFLMFMLQEQANNGNTWSTPMDLIQATAEFIPDVDKTLVGRMLLEDEEFYLTEDKGRISLLGFQRLELLVADQLERLLKAENDFDYEGWEEFVDAVEEAQGWKFTEQQRNEAMVMMLENNVSILQGYGGTGKTTTLKAVADILEEKGYLYAQCALSGKASNNLALVTGKEGSTISRLLGFSPIESGFYYNQKNPLPYDIIIIDEISMVDARLFGHLLLAVRTGAKIIMLGDSEQLEAIGIPIMIPMIKSGVIPTMTLTQIHRQAQKSAVVTDSIAIRQGKQILGRETGRVVHGELQDLEYDLVDSDEDIFLHVMREFYKYIQTEDIMDIQILTQQREKGKASCLLLNNACQKIYNPAREDKEEYFLGKVTKKKNEFGEEVEEKVGYYLREGDKVINVKNNYNAVDEDNMSCPVFNGNVGILERFDCDDEDGDKYMVINFEGIGRVKIYEGNYRSIELAYCITVHKSQGSSSKIVIIALPFHYTLNTRQLFYTAITRTRTHCVVIATKKTIVSAIQKNDVSNKRTYLAEYLQERLIAS
ncbi:AAA family ATPase [Priestia aryabhattai]|uniref:AAA family ATPase n=1 Tax=Priestia megaterium TaxID=1404 RepID=UPI003F963C7C